MAKAIFHRLFNATDTKIGVSIRVQPSEKPQSFPQWVITKAIEAGAATPYTKPRQVPVKEEN